MGANVLTRSALVVMLIVGGVGFTDAALSGEWDLLVVIVALSGMTLFLLALQGMRRPWIPVRADLVRWLDERATLGNEGIGDVADRAIAAYRAGLVGDESLEPRA